MREAGQVHPPLFATAPIEKGEGVNAVMAKTIAPIHVTAKVAKAA